MSHYAILRDKVVEELFWDADAHSLTHASSATYTPEWSKTGTSYPALPASVSARLGRGRAKDANSSVTPRPLKAYQLILRS
jgi:hypothetical protein